jgi:cell division ATPase FtsA
MKVREIIVGAKKSRNFQTYEVSYVLNFEDQPNITQEEVDMKVEEYSAKARKKCLEQLKLD